MPSNRNNRSTGAGRQGGTSRRQSSGVPPLDAFESTPKRRPPNLPGQPGFDPHAGNPGGSTRGTSQPGGGQGSAKRPASKKPARATGGSGAKQRAAQPAKKRKPKRRVSPARRRRRRFLAVFCTALVLIGAGVWFSLNVLFKIEGYTIEGETVYSQDEIVQAFGFDVGENMFSFNAKNRAETMRQTLPYLEELRIRRKLPGTVVFQATPAVETYTLEYNGGFVVLSESLKVLRIAESAPEDLVQLYGLSDVTTQPGLPLVVAIGEEDDYNPYQELPQPATDKVEPEEPPQDDTEPDKGGEGTDGDTDDGENNGDDPAQSTDGEGATDDSEGEGELATPEDTGSADGEPTDNSGDGEEGNADENDGENSDEPDENEEQTPEDTEPVRRELASPHERMEATLELIALLEKAGVEDVGWIDVTDTLNLRFRWQGRITVVLGARSSLEEKLACAIVIMEGGGQNPVGPNERGTVDVSAYTTTLMGYFTPE